MQKMKVRKNNLKKCQEKKLESTQVNWLTSTRIWD
jgi:hypothetical protein